MNVLFTYFILLVLQIVAFSLEISRLKTLHNHRQLVRFSLKGTNIEDNDDMLNRLDDIISDKAKVSFKSFDDIQEEKRIKDLETVVAAQASTKYFAPKENNKEVVTSNTFGKISLDELAKQDPEFDRLRRRQSVGKIKKEDLNGIDPTTPFIFATIPALMCFVGWKGTEYLASHFAIQFVDSDVYPLQRLAIVSRNVIVGMAALLSGFSGFIFLGLIVMGSAVAIGVAKGELDPNKKLAEKIPEESKRPKKY